jgi:hypothetical protein
MDSRHSLRNIWGLSHRPKAGSLAGQVGEAVEEVGAEASAWAWAWELCFGADMRLSPGFDRSREHL